MKFFPILALALALCQPAAQAEYSGAGSAAHSYAPAQGMLQSLEAMSTLLNSVHSRQAADTAVTQLEELYHQYLSQRDAAENMPEMNAQAMAQHLAQMDRGMNSFRLSCARLIQQKFYGSPRLGRTVKKIAQSF